MLKRNDPDYYTYYTIRAQDDYTKRKLKTEKLHFENMEVLLDFKANPNSKTLYVRIKDKLKDLGVEFAGNNIELNGIITEDQLIEEMKAINDSRKDV